MNSMATAGSPDENLCIRLLQFSRYWSIPIRKGAWEQPLRSIRNDREKTIG